MKKFLLLFVFTLLLVGCNANQATPSENVLLFGEINDMEDSEHIVFNWYEDPNEWNGGFSLYYDDAEMIGLIEDLKKMKISEGNLDEHDIGVGQPNSYLLAIAHETNNNLYTTLTVNDHGSVHIWNRYTNEETPTLYDSEGNGEFYDQVADIVSRENDRERNLTTKNKRNFEYKSETPQGTSIIEIRSENGKLIADLNDIKKGSVELVTDETGHPNLKLQFIDKEFVYHFTKAHMGEMTYLYVDGVLIASPMIMQPLLTNELIIAGDFDKVSIGEIISIIND